MSILIVTGKLAEKTIKGLVSDLEKDVDVLALPVTVASFITAKYAAHQLIKHDLSSYDMLIMPGSISGDLSLIEDAIGIPVYRGPIHAADLPLILSENIQLSKIQPANELIKSKLEEKALATIAESEEQWREILTKQGGLLIGDLPISQGLPMRVMGEIVNAPTLSLDEVSKRALYFESQGANIIDIGMLASNPKPKLIPKIINTIRETVDLPISIDTLNVDEIKASIDTGVDMILSLDFGNMEAIAPLVSNEAVVVLPTNMSRGILPKKAEERVKRLSEAVKILQEVGVQKIISDLVVEPLLTPGLLEGLKAYQLFNQSHPQIPLLFGVGNAVELIDADSPGVHAAMIALAREAGSCILHVPEYSVKAKGSVSEAVHASRMMFLAEKRGTVLKDLGLDLLLLKEKRWKELDYDASEEENARILQGVGETEYYPDKKGWFKIQIDRNAEEIVAIYYRSGGKEPDTIIRGKDSRVIYQTIIREKLISKYDHAAYLGKELEKAAIALKIGRSYVQDSPLF
ncbi:dihydropteroate synthase-like protein [Candidatus Bathyarchaeota archaeon]|nr:MAG: dihydropteroate synthase-like protein [Candidatus Bathyarchaeota archaeon]